MGFINHMTENSIVVQRYFANTLSLDFWQKPKTMFNSTYFTVKSENAFCFILKIFFVLEIFNFLSWVGQVKQTAWLEI